MRGALRPALRLAGAALSALPTAPSAWVAEALLGRNVFKTLHRAGYPETAERLLLHRLTIPPGRTLHSGTILIVGTPRIGKSTVAGAVARSLRMRVLSTDDLEPHARPEAATRQLLVRLCQKASGLVLEGMVLALQGQGKECSSGVPLAFDPVILQDENLHVFVVGCCTSSPESWETALRTRPGWLAAHGEDYLQPYARKLRERNRGLRDMALAAGVEYFEIPREDFAAAVEHTVEAIVARVRDRNR